MVNNTKILSKIVISICALVLCCYLFSIPIEASGIKVHATDSDSLIMSVDDLAKLYDNPSGDFQLGADIDMSGIDWKPLDFSGTLDGNGYAILNLRVSKVGDNVGIISDTDENRYDSSFAGFFGTLDSATVSNLKILGINVNINADGSCFAAALAGYMNNSHIVNCKVEGIIELSSTARCFGVGGIAGFGSGAIENSSADVTLICINKDVEEEDKRYIGGAISLGGAEVLDTTVNIQELASGQEIDENGNVIIPCLCGERAYEDIVVESTETTNGYIEHKCATCGYYYKDSYEVVVGNPEPIVEPKQETVTKTVKSRKKGTIILVVACAVVAIAVAAIYIIGSRKNKG